MGGDSSKPIGTDFKTNQRERRNTNPLEGDSTFPGIPSEVLKKAVEQIKKGIKTAEWTMCYKAEYRDALKRKLAKGHEPHHQRLHQKSVEAAGKTIRNLGEKDKALPDVANQIRLKVYELVEKDIINALLASNPQFSEEELLRSAESHVKELVMETMEYQINGFGEAILTKQQRGLNYEESDPELDPEEEAKKKAETEERRKKAAEERARKAAAWEAEKEKGATF